MCAWFKSKPEKFSEAQPPQTFSGVGVYFTSEVHSVRSAQGYVAPQKLIDAVASILGYQLAIIESCGGTIEQFVGDCVLAYWRPADLPTLLASVRDAGTRIILEKVTIPDLDFRLRVNFCAAEMAGAFFGPDSGRRFQVVGRARDRTNALPRFSPGIDCIFTDADTVAAMPADTRSAFVPLSPTVFSLQPSR